MLSLLRRMYRNAPGERMKMKPGAFPVLYVRLE
jgi:hypothetical protein